MVNSADTSSGGDADRRSIRSNNIAVDFRAKSSANKGGEILRAETLYGTMLARYDLN